MDYTTRYPEAIPMRSMTSAAVSRVLMRFFAQVTPPPPRHLDRLRIPIHIQSHAAPLPDSTDQLVVRGSISPSDRRVGGEAQSDSESSPEEGGPRTSEAMGPLCRSHIICPMGNAADINGIRPVRVSLRLTTSRVASVNQRPVDQRTSHSRHTNS